ncbi:hypothetical protein EVAR_35583_1 [Eumeta japonica]|uniref:Uncharacterized protein n=1 Tax=Eumeta variegata TaxID=151549 RepID=A0A4C1XNP5_EUMVA|nr:hypothetical protein EVAR_35583_1 [Eumeta japonica]
MISSADHENAPSDSNPLIQGAATVDNRDTANGYQMVYSLRLNIFIWLLDYDKRRCPPRNSCERTAQVLRSPTFPSSPPRSYPTPLRRFLDELLSGKVSSVKQERYVKVTPTLDLRFPPTLLGSTREIKNEMERKILWINSPFGYKTEPEPADSKSSY